MIVVTAASGNLGQAVANAFKGKVDPAGVRLAARTPAKLDAFRNEGFEVVQADYDDGASLTRAFAGADAALIISSAGPNEVRAAHHRTAIAAAKTAGVKLIVYTSAINPVSQSKFQWAGAHEQTEADLKASGIAYVILRDGSYASNIDGFIAKALETGVLALPGASTKVAYVTHADVAAAAVAALTGNAKVNSVYELTGPAGVDAFEIAAALSQQSGKSIKAVDLSLEDLAGIFGSMGLPPFAVDGVTSFFAASAAGEYANPTGDVETLTGRPPQSMRDYVKKFA